MLQNQQNETAETPTINVSTPAVPPSTAAAQVRVTPEELTQALNALQASKEAQASRLNGTLSIGQAVDEMGLDSTPEEIWKQIQSQRLQQEQEARQKQEAEERLHQPSASKQSLKAIAEEIAAEKLESAEAQVAQHHPLRGSKRGRQRGGWFVISLIAATSIFFFGGHSIIDNSDHTTTTLLGNHSMAMINGDDDTMTFSGNCGILIVNGDHDHLKINGRVGHIITNGDHNSIIWSTANNPAVPSKINNGDDNTFDVFDPVSH